MKWMLSYESEHAFDHDAPEIALGHDAGSDVLLQSRDACSLATRAQISAARFTARRLILSGALSGALAPTGNVRVRLQGTNGETETPASITVHVEAL